jgi:TonB-linked SusC/RagA family outer membrane protein
MCVALLLPLGAAWAQDRTVTGKVTSADDGSVLPGVNVIVKGTATGTATDAQGNFSINVSGTDPVLVFSFIGLKTAEVAVGTRNVVDVQLETDATQLSEVVVTGYQSQLKREITGSVASVKGEVIENLPMQSFDRAIQGRAAGTQIAAASGQPGGALNIRIRGISSINAGNDPLIIIDGVQVSLLGQTSQSSANPLNSINPNDIESIDILKDAAAAAIYGAQAANGVIVVTTKSGPKRGQQTSINITSQEGVVQPVNLYDVLNGAQFAELKEEQELNVGLDPTRDNGSHEFFGNPANPSAIDNYDWVGAMFRNARFRTTDVTMSGSTDKTSFYFGGSYNYQEAQIIKSNFERFTGRINISHRATDKLTLNTKISVAHIRQFGTIADGNFVNGPFVATFASIPSSLAVDPETGDYNPYPTNGLSHLFGYNILQGVNQEVRLGRTLQTVSSLSASYQILPELSVSALIGIDLSMNRDDNQRPRTIPAFAANGGSVLVNNRRSFNYNTNVNINYNKTFNDVHRVKAIVGYEYKEETREGAALTATGFSNAFFRLPSNGLPNATTGFYQDYKRLGYFGKVDYDYNDRYLASITARRDGHSRFGPRNQYGNFYAGSVGWRISEETFMSGLTFVDDLKLKASYGILGNAEIGNYEWNTAFGNSTGQYAGQTTLTVARLGNDEISWEEEESINLGLDFALVNNRIFGTIDFWRSNNNDLLLSVPFQQTGGINNSTIVRNVGSMRNEGIDIEVGGVIMDRAGFKWESRFNTSFLRNEVVSLVDSDTIFAGNIPSLIVGQPVDFFYLLDYAGVNPANGRTMIRNRNGLLSYTGDFADGAVRGSAIPSNFGGWTNTFSYKGIMLDIFFQYQLGNEAFNGDLYNLVGPGGNDNKRIDVYQNRWQQPGDVTNYPMETPNGQILGVDQDYGFIGTTRYMSDGSYVRLKTVTLSYDVPQRILSTIKVKSLRVFVQGVNLATWTKFDGIDPEVIANSNSIGTSSFGTYPLGRQFSAGINLGL